MSFHGDDQEPPIDPNDVASLTEKCTELTISDTSIDTYYDCNNYRFADISRDLNSTSDDDYEEADSSSGSTSSSTNNYCHQADRKWQKYWEEHGEAIVNKSWLEKYKDYINPEFDLSTWAGKDDVNNSVQHEHQNQTPQPSSGTGNEELETEDNSNKIASDGGMSEADINTLWAHEWEQHYSQIYVTEYKRFQEILRSATEEEEMDPQLKNGALKKYWVQRYHLFSKYDDGIKLDEESWFSVTPEVIAIHTAQRCKRVDGVIVDAFCGCGGNSIHFAKKFSKVISIDIDPVKIEYAKHNAKIYGVEDKIEFIVGDYLHIAPHLKADVVFLSPPWGGPNYASMPLFDLKTMKPLDGFTIFDATKHITKNIAFFVPRNTNKQQLMQLAGDNNFVEIERNMFKNRVKALTAYYGDLIKPRKSLIKSSRME